MKLTELYIHNYKSFYDTTIELDKMNIVVGENNSGKSNLIDVLEFIDIAMSKDIERAISDKGGYDRIKNYSAVGEEKVIVRATFEIENQEARVNNMDIKKMNGLITLSFSFSKNYCIHSILMNIRLNTDIYKDPLNYNSSFELINREEYHLEFIVSNKIFLDTRKTHNKLFVFLGTNLMVVNKYIGILFKYLLNMPINDYNKSYKFETSGSFSFQTYYFNTQTIRDKSNQDSKYSELLKDGSNLGKVLYEIKERDENSFEIISNSLITTVNEIDGIEVEKIFGSYVIGFKERGEEPIPIHTVSDGTINFLATITALNQNTNSSLLVFEEPERHLHIKIMDYLLEGFRADNRQILLTTHSTELLNYAKLEEIVFIYRDSDGDTQSIRAIDIPNLKDKMEALAYERPISLDEMIICGMVGDFE